MRRTWLRSHAGPCRRGTHSDRRRHPGVPIVALRGVAPSAPRALHKACARQLADAKFALIAVFFVQFASGVLAAPKPHWAYMGKTIIKKISRCGKIGNKH
jgi:hypothetical protein